MPTQSNVSSAVGPAAARAWPPAVLPPLLDRAVADAVYGAPHTLLALVARYGSPLHLVWPHLLQQNVATFRDVLDSHGVPHQLFYGAKVNKSQALMRAAVQAGIGIDVSSIHEMADALRAGADPARLCATGPAKTAAFHAALLHQGALNAVDSPEEFAELERCVPAMPAATSKARVLLRYRPHASGDSRFGMGGGALLACLQRLARQRDRFVFEGFHFHLGGYAWEPRAQAIRELDRYVEAARGLGLAPRYLDIGGGMPIRYVDGDACDRYLDAQGPDDYRHGTVPASFYPYGGRHGAAGWLAALLAAPGPGQHTIAAYLAASGMTLALEPGRSLVDQAAVSAFRITRVKQTAPGRHVVFVEGSSFSACETWFASEFLVDPVLVSAAPRPAAAPGTPVRAYIAGHSCLDDDVLTNRLIAFPHQPQAGDLLVFANTAGYQMDLLENEFHRHPLPRRIALTPNAHGGMDVSIDHSWKE
ncbi:MAG TPA: Y4yA family PLP-dependent enzyme [Burkholderiaceae bacterium]|nr:Y4yA family PLP-dependent enzyme [Burkholderiaceae bacterium]